MFAKSGYPPKDLEQELRKRAASPQKHDVCPRCGNPLLSRADDCERCNRCAWDNRTDQFGQPEPVEENKSGRSPISQFVRGRLGL